MGCYAVVRVVDDYNYIRGVDFVSCFNTQEEAENFINDKEKESFLSNKKLTDYVDNYINSIDIPTGSEDWIEFVSKFPFSDLISYSKDKFKDSLKLRLLANYRIRFDGFDPPNLINESINLFVVHIENCCVKESHEKDFCCV